MEISPEINTESDYCHYFFVRGGLNGREKVPQWTVSIENYRNTEQTKKTSKSFFESSVHHKPTACTFTQKMPTIDRVARIFKGIVTKPLTGESNCVYTTCTQFVCLFILLPLRLTQISVRLYESKTVWLSHCHTVILSDYWTVWM